MKLEGGCYCGAVRYVAEGEPIVEGAMPLPRVPVHHAAARRTCSCSCRPTASATPRATPKTFARSDLEKPVTREFCAECGTHLVTRRPGLPAVILKVGTLDDPGLFGTPQMAIYTVDKQAFHHIPDGLPTFERLPKR